jgi:hypothetical protein
MGYLADGLEQYSRPASAGRRRRQVGIARPSRISIQEGCAFTPNDVERLMATRNRAQSKEDEAIIANAEPSSSIEISVASINFTSFGKTMIPAKDLHKRFRFLGESAARMSCMGSPLTSWRGGQRTRAWRAHGHAGWDFVRRLTTCGRSAGPLTLPSTAFASSFPGCRSC